VNLESLVQKSLVLLFGLSCVSSLSCSEPATPRPEAKQHAQVQSFVQLREAALQIEVGSNDSKEESDPVLEEDDQLGQVRTAIMSAWDKFRFGSNDQTEQISNRCRQLPNITEHLRAEMLNMRSALEEAVGTVSEIKIKVLSVERISSNEMEATTQLTFRGAPLSSLGTQRLILDSGHWKADNCNERELKVSFDCAVAFGEPHRGDCIAFWFEVVRPSDCDLRNENFARDFAEATYGPNPVTDEQWSAFVETCHLIRDPAFFHRKS